MDIENAYSTHEISWSKDYLFLARSRHGLRRYATLLFTTQSYTYNFILLFSPLQPPLITVYRFYSLKNQQHRLQGQKEYNLRVLR